jgi:2-polyprenyl-3-methyl-5-hydroxy-6-metoxy-1,4-benzoquinol methylase
LSENQTLHIPKIQAPIGAPVKNQQYFFSLSGLKDPTVFNKASTNYDKIRPGYPPELFKDLKRLTGVTQSGRILEIGCGTGQATLPLATEGFDITCMDIGESLLEIARSKAAKYSRVRFIHASFEDWVPEAESFDLIISATAFHWVNPEIGYTKAAHVLKKTGNIALFWNKHPTPYTGFFIDAQRVYREVVPEWGAPSMRPIDEWITEQVGLIEGSGCFGAVTVRQYPWVVSLTTEEYLQLLDTYSDHGNLKPDKKKRLYAGIADMINEKYGGAVKRPYLSVLFTAQKSN